MWNVRRTISSDVGPGRVTGSDAQVVKSPTTYASTCRNQFTPVHNYHQRHLAGCSLCSQARITLDIYALEHADAIDQFPGAGDSERHDQVRLTDVAWRGLVLNPTLDAISGRITGAGNRAGRYITLTGTAAPPQRRRRRRRRPEVFKVAHDCSAPPLADANCISTPLRAGKMPFQRRVLPRVGYTFARKLHDRKSRRKRRRRWRHSNTAGRRQSSRVPLPTQRRRYWPVSTWRSFGRLLCSSNCIIYGVCFICCCCNNSERCHTSYQYRKTTWKNDSKCIYTWCKSSHCGLLQRASFCFHEIVVIKIAMTIYSSIYRNRVDVTSWFWPSKNNAKLRDLDYENTTKVSARKNLVYCNLNCT